MPAVARMLGMAGAGSSYDTVMSFIVLMPNRVRLMVLMVMVVGTWRTHQLFLSLLTRHSGEIMELLLRIGVMLCLAGGDRPSRIAASIDQRRPSASVIAPMPSERSVAATERSAERSRPVSARMASIVSGITIAWLSTM